MPGCLPTSAFMYCHWLEGNEAMDPLVGSPPLSIPDLFTFKHLKHMLLFVFDQAAAPKSHKPKQNNKSSRIK